MNKLQQLKREKVEIPKRRRLRKAEREEVETRDGGCVDCGAPIDECEEEHDIPRTILPDDTTANVFLRCKPCHRRKTTKDRKDIAKYSSLEKKDRGEVTKKRRPFQNRGFPPKGSRPKIQSRGFSKIGK